MKTRYGFIGIVVLLTLVACHTPTREARRMIARAERLVDTLPDSTARLIDSVLRMEAYLSERQRMDMALLQAEALFGSVSRNVSSSVSDRAIDDFGDVSGNVSTSPELEHAATYYARKKEYDKAARAALYSGFVQEYYNDKTVAMQSFKDAERYGSMVDDSIIVAWSEYKMGKMLYYDGMEQEAIAILKNSERNFGYRFAEKALAQNLIGACYLLQGDFTNAGIYLKRSLINADKGNSNKVKNKALNNCAVLYQLQGEYPQAIKCLKQIAENPNLDNSELLLYMNLGNVYIEAQEMDSADLYYKHVDSLLPTTIVKLETQLAAYDALLKFAKRQSNDSLALQYCGKHENILYTIMRQRQEQSIYRIQQQYDYETLQNEMSQNVIRRQRLIIILSIVVALVLLAFTISQIRLARIRKQEAEIKASLLRFMKQNEELTKQSEAVKKANHDLEQKHQEIEEARQNLAYQVEEYKNAYEASDKKLSKALLKEHQIMQKMAVFLENKKDSALFEALKYSVLGNQEYWDAMLRTFDRQFPGMRKQLVLQYPELTETEQKILLLSYVDASREDTAVLLDISIFMVDKLRTSVKKKMAKQALKGSEKT